MEFLWWLGNEAFEKNSWIDILLVAIWSLLGCWIAMRGLGILWLWIWSCGRCESLVHVDVVCCDCESFDTFSDYVSRLVFFVVSRWVVVVKLASENSFQALSFKLSCSRVPTVCRLGLLPSSLVTDVFLPQIFSFEVVMESSSFSRSNRLWKSPYSVLLGQAKFESSLPGDLGKSKSFLGSRTKFLASIVLCLPRSF